MRTGVAKVYVLWRTCGLGWATVLPHSVVIPRRIATVLLLGILSGPTCTNYADDARVRVVHVVLVWLKEAGNPDHRARIIEATRSFSAIPGVEEIKVGEPIPNARPSADDSFDVGLYMVFSSRGALESYLTDPAHQKAQQSILRPLVKRVLVYDFIDDSG